MTAASPIRSGQKAPVIAIVGGTVNAAVNFSARQIVCCVSDAILALVRDHGGIPLVLPDSMTPADAMQIIHLCDGLLLPPGRDVHPLRYGEQPAVTYGAAEGVGTPGKRPAIMAPDVRRDAMEIALFKMMEAASKPILGICRGMQVINVARGGTLIQELPEGLGHFVENDGWIPYHPMILQPKSRMAGILGTPEVTVSSVHHQGIERLGTGLVAAGHAPDGLVEAIEDAEGAFIFGLQSHPEKTRRNFPQTERLFAAFVTAAADRSTAREPAETERMSHV
ncbi:gamma-glutamyl-gamma-aminobutyrate hydrolase family protein [Tabrizicola aquatica]|uniref:gamma-glutamyl-gamma-aminobutyrate hydrolase family protein n=1 Tax=Tabrizicola aquatica TaxID=909926 RepID=UPI000CD2A64F|nr:gamma-glutamyl-gamma-aminobutyrate hydrolase family protein [Tabrizicola aquatica]